MYQEYKIQILEQPAERWAKITYVNYGILIKFLRIKFRSVAPTSKCQAAELLYGRVSDIKT